MLAAFRILIPLFFCLPFVSADVLEIRTVKSSRPLSSAIKTNLDGGTLSTDRFEATYDKLASEKKIDEISRFIKTDPSDSLMNFETTAPSSRWKTLVEAQTIFAKGVCEGMFHVVVSPPGSATEPPSVLTSSTVSLDYGRWHVISEMNFGTEMIMTLVKVTSNGTEQFPDEVPVIAVEGYLVPMKEVEADKTSRYPTDKIDALIARITSGNDAFDSFRYPAVSGQKSMISKVGDKHPGYKNAGSGALAARIDSEATLSPDGKWAYLHIQSVVEEVDGTKGFPAYANRFEDTLRVGTWKVIPAERHPAGESVVLFARITHLRADRWKPKPTAPLRPLPATGTVSRTYADIHPSAVTKLSAGRDRLPIKDLLVKHGVPDSGWSAILVSNHLIVGRADVSVHQRIEDVLADFTWTKEIAKKTAATQ